MRLHEIAGQFGTDKFEHGYCEHYEHHVGNPATIIELGVETGASLRMWKARWPDARVIGVDLNPPREPIRGCEVYQCDARKVHVQEWLPDQIDLIVDDASHRPFQITEAFRALWPYISPGGWYAIEDCACAFERVYGGNKTAAEVGTLLSWLLNEAADGRIEYHVYGELILIYKIARGQQ